MLLLRCEGLGEGIAACGSRDSLDAADANVKRIGICVDSMVAQSCGSMPQGRRDARAKPTPSMAILAKMRPGWRECHDAARMSPATLAADCRRRSRIAPSPQNRKAALRNRRCCRKASTAREYGWSFRKGGLPGAGGCPPAFFREVRASEISLFFDESAMRPSASGARRPRSSSTCGPTRSRSSWTASATARRYPRSMTIPPGPSRRSARVSGSSAGSPAWGTR